MRENRKEKRLKCFDAPISGGKYKGKKILIPDILTTRSSKSILRESLFDTLQFDIVDKNFVEVFAGSGSVGLEALSRGAQKAFFIEKNRQVYNILVQNIASIAPAEGEAILADSFEYFSSLLKSLEKDEKKSYFYFDPPFSIRDGMSDIYQKTTDAISSINPQKCEMVVIEHMSSIDMPEDIGPFILKKRRKFGKSSLSYYAPDTEE